MLRSVTGAGAKGQALPLRRVVVMSADVTKGGALLPPATPLGILVNVRVERRGLSAAEQATPETGPRRLCRWLLLVGQ